MATLQTRIRWLMTDGVQMAAEKFANVELIPAYLPDPYGTHHSKMMILLRHDDSAQIIIHTANMIPRDWRNMTQAAWISPLLPKLSESMRAPSQSLPLGSGERFKIDILTYLGAYEKRLRNLTTQLSQHDFSAIRAAFLGSAPSHQAIAAAAPRDKTSFGWLGLQQILSSIPVQRRNSQSPPNIVAQVSSIATLGQKDTWLSHFKSILESHLEDPLASHVKSESFESSKIYRTASSSKPARASLNIIFPTPHEIRTSLDGYASGGSIHTKIQTPAQQKQLDYLRPLLCHWKSSPAIRDEPSRQAMRGPAAPHIKTYIRFNDATRTTIDWALVTSANLSKQAWGEQGNNKKGEVWIQSYETGVLVWPSLFGEVSRESGGDGGDAIMVPVFGKDIPTAGDLYGADLEKESNEGGDVGGGSVRTVVGLRMPYDLPLVPYGADEVPWCATMAHEEPDWMGQRWLGY